MLTKATQDRMVLFWLLIQRYIEPIMIMKSWQQELEVVPLHP